MIISGQGLSKAYRDTAVLKDLSLSCDSGEICGVLGSNGAGKTTLFKILCGLIKPDAGQVKIHSNRDKPIGAIIEKPALYEYLNAYENLYLFSSIQNAPTDRESLEKMLVRVGLPLDRKDPVRNFSMGMKQRLGIAIALLNEPECLILDEPFSGLDPMGIADLRQVILTLAEKEKLAILVSSHIIDELSKICSRLYVIHNGEIKNEGPTQKLINHYTESYLICAENLGQSEELKTLDCSFRGECASVNIAPKNIALLLQKLSIEGIVVTSCTPEINMNKLFIGRS